MFSGIIEEVGEVSEAIREPGLLTLRVQARICLEDTKVGDSISVNGVCLTVCHITHEFFSCQIIPETLKRTNLAKLSLGSKVNLERSILPTTRIGGHIIQGHVDGITSIKRLEPEGESLKIWFHKPDFWKNCFIPKGSICLDGMSLTLVDSLPHEFSVCLIPYTKTNTIVNNYYLGEIVNIEIDYISKTLSQIMSQRTPYVT